jgi:hypothetical protein
MGGGPLRNDRDVGQFPELRYVFAYDRDHGRPRLERGYRSGRIQLPRDRAVGRAPVRSGVWRSRASAGAESLRDSSSSHQLRCRIPGGLDLAAAIVFAFMYGAGNGLLTITRGTVPLVLFDPGIYGRVVGRLVAPGFLVSATAPIAYAATITHYGEAGALLLSAIVSTVGAFAALALFVLAPRL